MKINQNEISKFQMGGPVPDPNMASGVSGDVATTGDQTGQGTQSDPLMQIAQVAAEALQTQNCEAAMAVCDAFLQLIQQATSQAAPEAAPAEPTFQRKGGKLVRKD